MCLIVLPEQKVNKLCVAVQNIQSLLSDGTLTDAFSKTDGHSVQLAVTGFDILAERVNAILEEQNAVSPFLRYRREILGQYETAARLRAMVMNLWGGRPANLSLLFHHADEHHARIALDCITHFARHGENDTFFMSLASEIAEQNAPTEVAA